MALSDITALCLNHVSSRGTTIVSRYPQIWRLIPERDEHYEKTKVLNRSYSYNGVLISSCICSWTSLAAQQLEISLRKDTSTLIETRRKGSYKSMTLSVPLLKQLVSHTSTGSSISFISLERFLHPMVQDAIKGSSTNEVFPQNVRGAAMESMLLLQLNLFSSLFHNHVVSTKKLKGDLLVKERLVLAIQLLETLNSFLHLGALFILYEPDPELASNVSSYLSDALMGVPSRSWLSSLSLDIKNCANPLITPSGIADNLGFTQISSLWGSAGSPFQSLFPSSTIMDHLSSFAKSVSRDTFQLVGSVFETEDIDDDSHPSVKEEPFLSSLIRCMLMLQLPDRPSSAFVVDRQYSDILDGVFVAYDELGHNLEDLWSLATSGELSSNSILNSFCCRGFKLDNLGCRAELLKLWTYFFPAELGFFTPDSEKDCCPPSMGWLARHNGSKKPVSDTIYLDTSTDLEQFPFLIQFKHFQSLYGTSSIHPYQRSIVLSAIQNETLLRFGICSRSETDNNALSRILESQSKHDQTHQIRSGSVDSQPQNIQTHTRVQPVGDHGIPSSVPLRISLSMGRSSMDRGDSAESTTSRKQSIKFTL